MGRYRKDSFPELAGQQDEGQALWEKVAQTVKRRNLQQALQPEKQPGESQKNFESQSADRLFATYSIGSRKSHEHYLLKQSQLISELVGITGIDRSSARRLRLARCR